MEGPLSEDISSGPMSDRKKDQPQSQKAAEAVKYTRPFHLDCKSCPAGTIPFIGIKKDEH